MTLITINTVRDRVMELCALIELPAPLGLAKGVHKDVSECSFAASSLPAFVVKADPQRGGEFTYDDVDVTYSTTREIHIGLYIAHIKDESYARDMDMVDLTEEAAQTVVHYFAKKRTLALNYDHGVVDRALIIRSTAPHTMGTKGSDTKNRGIQFRMLVTFRNQSLQDDE